MEFVLVPFIQGVGIGSTGRNWCIWFGKVVGFQMLSLFVVTKAIDVNDSYAFRVGESFVSHFGSEDSFCGSTYCVTIGKW